MENASKALIMAAGVLISVLILTLAVYLVVNFGSFSAEVHQRKQEDEIQRFNAQFLAYQGNETVTMHDIVTIVNYAKDNNSKYELTSGYANNKSSYYVTVTLDGMQGVETQSQDTLDSYIVTSTNNIDIETADMPRYNCKIMISDVTGRVYHVVFTTPKS